MTDLSDTLAFVPPRELLPLYFHTATNMQAAQLTGIVERKIRHAVVPRLPIDFDRRYERRVPSPLRKNAEPIAGNLRTLRRSLTDDERTSHRRSTRKVADGKVTFLDRTIDFGSTGDLDWEHPDMENYPLLWRLKLQSFEFLEWLVLGYERPSDTPEINARLQRWMVSWSDTNRIGEKRYLRRSWIPHSVSLRILNLCRYCAWCEGAGVTPPEALYRVIYKNALFLENHVEYDVGGNHLIENAVALTVAGVFFYDHETDWVRRGTSVLTEAASDQFLADGGHFERSPMYHLMVLRRYLTAIDLLERVGIRVPPRIQQTAERALGYLRAIRGPDGRIPLLNDSVYGEELAAPSCLRYAGRIGVEPEDPEQLDFLDASGYYWLGTDRHRMLVDGGAVGPKHLPAHSHNDQLSFLLWVDDQPMITDTGTYEYAPTDRRQYSRSVRAHNTVQVGDTEPIDIGGQYLMGRRSTPTVRVTKSGQETTFEGTFSKRSLMGTSYTHDRRIVSRDGSWVVRDEVSGDESFMSRIHLHPAASISETDAGVYTVSRESVGPPLVVTALSEGETAVERSEYYPSFGVSVERDSLVLTCDSDGRCEYRLDIDVRDASRSDSVRGREGRE